MYIYIGHKYNTTGRYEQSEVVTRLCLRGVSKSLLIHLTSEGHKNK